MDKDVEGMQKMDINFNFLDSEEFYNLMQDYRNAPVYTQSFALEIYCKIKRYIRTEISKQIIEEKRCEDFNDID